MVQSATSAERADLRVLRSPKRVRARVGGVFVADSRRALLVYTGPFPTAYAFPREDVREDLLDARDAADDKRYGRVRVADLRVGDRVVHAAARSHDDGPLDGHVTFEWDKMDDWYEETEQVFVHPHDPNHRIDVLQSDRHVEIALEGTKLAESRRPVLLFETGLPVRYYLPHMDVALGHLRPSETTTGCPYKGFATYHHVEVDGRLHKDLVWSYKAPFHEALKIQGLLCFYDERLDVTVDGEPQERARTQWSD